MSLYESQHLGVDHVWGLIHGAVAYPRQLYELFHCLKLLKLAAPLHFLPGIFIPCASLLG